MRILWTLFDAPDSLFSLPKLLPHLGLQSALPCPSKSYTGAQEVPRALHPVDRCSRDANMTQKRKTAHDLDPVTTQSQRKKIEVLDPAQRQRLPFSLGGSSSSSTSRARALYGPHPTLVPAAASLSHAASVVTGQAVSIRPQSFQPPKPAPLPSFLTLVDVQVRRASSDPEYRCPDSRIHREAVRWDSLQPDKLLGKRLI